jgi:predicted protein tyrosine phosphatase
MRSRTAEELYRGDRRFEVRSAGTSVFAERHIDEEILSWADYIVVMEEDHKKKIREQFPVIYARRKVLCLRIPDIYYFMDSTLIREIKERFEAVYRDSVDDAGNRNSAERPI